MQETPETQVPKKKKKKECRFDDPWVRKIPWIMAWQPTQEFFFFNFYFFFTLIFFTGKCHGQRSLAGNSLWSCKEWNTAGHRTHTHTVELKESPGLSPLLSLPWVAALVSSLSRISSWFHLQACCDSAFQQGTPGFSKSVPSFGLPAS